MRQTTAGRLLIELAKESAAKRDAIAIAAGIMPDRAAAAVEGSAELTLAEQLRLAEATILCAPRYARHALRLRDQALAARTFREDTAGPAPVASPLERWERSPHMRR